MPIASPPDDDEDRTKARAEIFFERGQAVAETGNYEYAIEMYIQGLNVDPDNVKAHQALRDISLKRKANGGTDIGMFDKMKLPKANYEEQAMLNAEKLLAYLPGDVGRIRGLLDAAQLAGMRETAEWIGTILRRAVDP
jgi:tetratricopeptide (TPR) repeat protein